MHDGKPCNAPRGAYDKNKMGKTNKSRRVRPTNPKPSNG